MPKIRTTRGKPPPEGWDQIESTLDQFTQKMREAECKPHTGLKKSEALWPIFRIHHQRSRYVYELYFKRKAISKELYEYCVKQGYADANLIAKWKKVQENILCNTHSYLWEIIDWLRESLLSSLHTDKRYEFRFYLYLSCTKE